MDPRHTFLVSPYIGAKVFLNIFTEIFAYAPTKVKLLITNSEENEKAMVMEIPSKNASTKRLRDYGISASSLIIIYMCSEDEPNLYKKLSTFIKE